MMQGPFGLYWGNLSKAINESVIVELCTKINIQPIYVKVFKSKTTKEPLGSALVLFALPMDAEKVAHEMNNASLDGKSIRIMPYVSNFKEMVDPKACIVIYHLPPAMTQKDLFSLCSEFGAVQSCYLPVKEGTGESTCTGFVMFSSFVDKEIALSKLNNVVLKDGTTPLKVFPYFRKEERVLHRFTKGTFNNLYVKGLPKEGFTEENLREIFGKYGELHSVILNKDQANPSLNSGSAFVCFKENDNAMKAKEELHGKEIKGAKLYVDRHYKKAQMAALREAQKKLSTQQWLSKYPDCNLYIRPIPEKVTKKTLETLFAKFGTVISVKIPEGPDKKPKNYAFVCLSQKEEAYKAIAALNGKRRWKSIITVTLAEDKEKAIAEQAQALGYFPYQPPMPAAPEVQERIPAEEKKELGTQPSVAPPQPVEQKEEENPYYLDKKYLRKATPEEKKQYLGEKLYIIVSEKEPQLASKITGALLGKDIEEVITLFDEIKITEQIAELKNILSECSKTTETPITTNP